MEKLTKQLTLKYALLQSTYWINYCCICSFAAVYLKSHHFSNTQIGLVMALAAILSILLQPTVASIADKSEKITLRYMVMLITVIVLVLAFALRFITKSFLSTACIYILIIALQYTLNPLLNSLAIEYINKGVLINYGLARGIGSISFAFMSPILGIIVNQFKPGVLITIFLFLYPLVILSIFLLKADIPKSAQLPGVQNKTSAKREPSTGVWTFFLKYKKFTILLVGVSMLYYSHSMFNTYLINIVENVGGNSSSMGISLSIAAALELPTMAAFAFLVKKIKCSTLFKISALFFLLKAALSWLAPNVTTIYLAMSFQLLGFALYTPSSVYYVNSIMDDNDKIKGQAMLGVATHGIACTLANITGGRLLDSYGASPMLLVGTIVTAIGLIIVLFTTENIGKIYAK